MKSKLIHVFFYLFSTIGFAQSTNTNSFFENFELYFSPFQTRIVGMEYNLNKENKKGSFGTETSARIISVNDFEVGSNYLFCLNNTEFGGGLSFYTDSYKFLFKTQLQNKLYRIDRRGLSLNLFYRKQIFQGTSIDLGINTRFAFIADKSNRNDYNQSNQVSSTLNVLVYEEWSYLSSLEFIPSIQFNTSIYKGFYLKYGIYAKFWGKEFFSVIATEKYTSEDIILDFNVNQSTFKGTISVGYKFK